MVSISSDQGYEARDLARAAVDDAALPVESRFDALESSLAFRSEAADLPRDRRRHMCWR
jgi:hypothetical protein